MNTIELTEQELAEYWPNFQAVAYALYDDKNVLLYHHPNYNEKPYKSLNWTEQFVGSTLILFEDYPTAIVDVSYYKDYASLYSILIHELFHGYQFLQEEKRFANEMLGVTYPLSEENIELRNRERKWLYQTLTASAKEEKLFNLQQFVSTREERQKNIGEFLEYENLVETIEGPAWYVELKAFAEKSDLPYNAVLPKYIEPLLNKQESTVHLRRSCYSSGLSICLLLDEFSPQWKTTFFQSEKSLYEFFKEIVNVETEPLPPMTISHETKKLINIAERIREEEISSFSEMNGYHIVIEGKMAFSAIDPMNIIQSKNRCLHKNFIEIKINNQKILFQQPVLTYFEEHIRNIVKLHLVLSERPELEDGFLNMNQVVRISTDGLTVSILNS